MTQAHSKSGSGSWLVVVLVVGLLAMIAMCSPSKDKTAQSFASPSLSNQIESMPTPTPAPISALSPTSLGLGKRHFTAVAKAEGLSGMMVYSQNCYDALSRSFSWAKLDLCGAFDMLAVKAADVAEAGGLTTEVEYFGSEAAAGRYLAVAAKAGEGADEADQRLEALQRRASALAPQAKKEAPAASDASVNETEVPLDNVADIDNDV
jgi:hypothetical protein